MFTRSIKTLVCLAGASLLAALPAHAQTKLKWAHVYETSEAFHTESVWAAQEFAKRTNNKYQIEVFPASQLGKETDINQGLSLGSVDIIISGSSFAARAFPPIGVTYYPFTFRGPEHLLAYTKSDVYKELTGGYEEKTGHIITATTYYGTRHTTSTGHQELRRHEGPEDARSGRAGLSRHAASCGANTTADSFRRSVSRAAERQRWKRRRTR